MALLYRFLHGAFMLFVVIPLIVPVCFATLFLVMLADFVDDVEACLRDRGRGMGL